MEMEFENQGLKEKMNEKLHDSVTDQDCSSLGERHGGHYGYSLSDRPEDGEQDTSHHNSIYKMPAQECDLEDDEGEQDLH